MKKEETFVSDKEVELLKKENKELMSRMSKMVEMDLTYQWYIPQPPLNKTQLYGQSCSNDGITVLSWIDQWINNITENAKHDFHANSALKEFGKQSFKPVIIAGSGPSLKKNAHFLKDRKGICLVSCLHNYGYFEEIGVTADYYVNLDAGEITISEVSEGSKFKTEEEVWESTKDKTLVTSIIGNPKLIEKWKGKILWYLTVIPQADGMAKCNQITNNFNMFFQCGGNALGSALYFAKAVLGGTPIIFVGADFSFSYTKKFHPFDSKYDQKFAGVVPVTDVFGNRVYTWQSYFNFKCWFEFMAMGGEGNNPQIFINSTEGGILGAYAEGNIISILQMPLKMVLDSYCMHKSLPEIHTKNLLLF